MKIKREISIAIIVGCLMVIAVVLIIAQQRGEKDASDISSVKVLKLNETENEEGVKDYFYTECRIATDDLFTIKKEIKRAFAMGDDKIQTGKSIKGSYKVMLDDKYVAFDNKDDKIIYNGTKNRIYSFDSKMFEIILNTCE